MRFERENRTFYSCVLNSILAFSMNVLESIIQRSLPSDCRTNRRPVLQQYVCNTSRLSTAEDRTGTTGYIETEKWIPLVRLLPNCSDIPNDVGSESYGKSPAYHDWILRKGSTEDISRSQSGLLRVVRNAQQNFCSLIPTKSISKFGGLFEFGWLS